VVEKRAASTNGASPPPTSATAVAAEALRTGILSGVARSRRSEIPREEQILVGDPDDRSLDNE
jgi:hypothetical protein